MRSLTRADLDQLARRYGLAVEAHEMLGRSMPGVLVVYSDHESEVLFTAPTERAVRAYFYALAAEIALKVLTEPDGEVELVFDDVPLLEAVLGQREAAAADIEHHAWRLTVFPINPVN